MRKIYLTLLISLGLMAQTFGQCFLPPLTPKNPTCNGSCDGTITANPFSGTAPYTYTWSTTPAQTTKTAVGLCAGSYTVTVKDAGTCVQTRAITLTDPTPIVLTTGQTNVTCNGGTNGSATVTATGGTVTIGYTYSWSTSPTQTTKTASGLSAGTYTITVKDNNGCIGTADVTITQPVAITLVTSVVDATCGNADGSASVTASNGVGPYTYSWNSAPAQTTATATNLIARNYRITVTDSKGCSTSAAVTVGNVGGFIASITSKTNVSCNGGSDGSATVSASGGTSPYTYSWNTSPVQTTTTASGLTAGTYIVVAADAGGCSFPVSVTILQPPVLAVSVANKSVTCNGTATGDATASVSGGTPPYSYSWSTSPVQTTAIASGLTAGTYTVSVTDKNGCTATKATTITEPTALVSGISSSTNVSCNGGSNGSATVTASGGTFPYTFLWDTSPAQTTAAAGTLSAGTYSVTVTDNKGCTSISSVTITQPAAIALTTSSVDATCGNADGSASVTASGGTPGYTYSWSTSPVKTTASVTGLVAGNYRVTVTDSKGCTNTAGVTVNNVGGFSASISASTNVSCNGGNNGTATVSTSGGIPTYTYSWSTSPVQTTVTATGLTAGTYTVVASDGSGCFFPATVVITQPPVLSVTISNANVTCFGSATGSAMASVSGGTPSYTYSWNTSPVQTKDTASGLTAGTYIVTVTDNNGCSTTKSTNITEPPLLVSSVSAHTNVTCNGGSNGTATASGGGGTAPYAYLWETSPVQPAKTVSNLTAGTFTVVVRDNMGCTSKSTVTITEPTAIVLATASTNATCNNSDGTASVTATGGTPGYTYSWFPGGATTATASGLSAGVYNITVRDANSCAQTKLVTVANSGTGTPSATGTNVLCKGGNTGTATVSMTGGSSPFTYMWSTSPSQTTVTATGLTAGTYTVQVTEASGCISFANVTITEPAAALTASTSETDATCIGCADGTASVTAAGGTAPYSYLWSPGGYTASTATGLTAGTYTVCVTDANACNTCSTVTVFQPTSTGIVANVSNNSLFIYPNPSTGEFTIVINNSQVQNMTLVISNVLGQVIYSEKLSQVTGTYTKTINLDDYKKGIYQLQLIGEKQSITRKIILE